MKKIFQIIAFQIGVDVLGFPQFHTHQFEDTVRVSGKYFKSYSKK